jgi:hypothetical protein
MELFSSIHASERTKQCLTGHVRVPQRELEGEAELQKARAELQEKISAAEEERANALEEQSGLIGKVRAAADIMSAHKTNKLGICCRRP